MTDLFPSAILFLGLALLVCFCLKRQTPARIPYYQQAITLPEDQVITLFEQRYQQISKILPDFPAFPKVWLLPPKERGRYASLGECYCIQFMELLFPNHEFKKVRPTWLRNPKTGRCLELDGYNDELKIGIEFNGKQHYSQVPMWNSSEEEFKYQQERDRLKEELCKENNVCLIVIPYTVPVKRIPLAIYGMLLDSIPPELLSEN